MYTTAAYLLEGLHHISLIPLLFLNLCFFAIAIASLLDRRKPQRPEAPAWPEAELPIVTLQIPTFNDPVALRCLEHVLALDYPPEKLEIVLVDDSTDPDVVRMFREACEATGGRARHVHRTHRQGFKPGALQEALPGCRGAFVAIFDADWMPAPDFLRRALPPFQDPRVAVVQTRQGYDNLDASIVSRFAAHLLMVYHHIVLPLQDRVDSAFLCGTAGIIRREALEAVGGWNAGSITEDADLTVRLLLEGWTCRYLPMETPSEVPITLGVFARQQARWCSGNVRVFLDHWRAILGRSSLGPAQRFWVTYAMILGHMFAPWVVLATATGLMGWWFVLFPGDLAPRPWDAGRTLFELSFATGFLGLGVMTLAYARRLREVGWLLLEVLVLGPLLAITNARALLQALLPVTLDWVCTPKQGNASFALERRHDA